MGYACPDCHGPIDPPKRGHDARCARCRRLFFEEALQAGSRWALRLRRTTQQRKAE